MIVISSECEEFPDAIRWRFFDALRLRMTYVLARDSDNRKEEK